MAEDNQKKMKTRSSRNQSPKKDDSLASPNQTDLGNNPDEGFVTTTSSQNANGQFFWCLPFAFNFFFLVVLSLTQNWSRGIVEEVQGSALRAKHLFAVDKPSLYLTWTVTAYSIIK